MANLCMPTRCVTASSKSLLALSIAMAVAPKIATAQNLEEVVVTGSRIARSGFDSAQPLSVIDSTQIENLGLVNVGDVLRTLPQNTPFFTDTNVGIGNFNVGAQLANLRGLNPYFGTRTLTLVDTKRVVPNTEGGAIDLTLIPSMLVGRTEVVTGGASAAYGSDAIAGVVNVILDTDLEGFRAQLDFADADQAGGSDRHVSIAYGQGFSDDRVHLLLGIEAQHQDPIGPCSQNRDWCRESWLVANNSGFAGGNGYPNYVVAPNAKYATSENGLIAPCLDAACAPGAGRGAFQSFNADGTDLVPYDPGMWSGGFGGRVGGDGTVLQYDLSSIRPDVERTAALGHVDIDLSDSLTLSFQLAHSQSDSRNHPANGALGPFGGGVRIRPDNAYLTPALQAALPFGGVVNRIFAPDVISATNTTEAETTRFVTSIDGSLTDNWSWDAYYEHGESTYHQQLIHNADRSILSIPTQYGFFGWATDAVRSDPLDPASAIVCRATIATDPAYNPLAAGCLPLNFFGVGNSDAAALDYVYRTLKEDSDYTQDVVGVNFRGDVAEGWGAGPISAAFGAEFRSDESDVTHDMANQPWYTSYLLSWGLDRGGKIDVAEIYGEIQVPIVEKVNADFAMRETRNEAASAQAGVAKNSHDFSSWKAAVTYDATDSFRVRATRSRDVRGAGFRELFLPRVTTPGTVGGFPGGIQNPWNSNAEENYLSITGGNPFLDPEEADTSAFGVVMSFDRLQFSADWYEIDLKGAIAGAPGAQAVVDACFRGAQGACDAIVQTGSGASTDIISVETGSINLASYLTRGVDFEVNYNVSLQEGSLNLRVISSYLYDMIIDTGLGDAPINYHGQSGPVGAFGGFNTSPDWQANAWLTYSRSRFTTTLETKYIGAGTLSALRFESPIGSATNTQINSISDNSVDSRIYFAWTGSYDFQPRDSGNQLQLFWAVNNLLDEDPPIAPGGNAFPTNPVFFDTIGRRVRAGVRLQF
jgi:outer membrane receptor protein involved in Fe transport